MPALHTGEIWKLQIDNEFRRVKVIGAAGLAGWWRCVDLATDISFLARQHWFIEQQVKAGGSALRAHNP